MCLRLKMATGKDEIVSKLQKELGLSKQKAEETAKNNNVVENVIFVLNEASKIPGDHGKFGSLFYHLASNIKKQCVNRIPLIVEYIVNGGLDNVQRIDAAFEFFLSNISEKVDKKKFEEACGIGVVVTPEQIEQSVEKAIKKHKDNILEKRYRFPSGILMQNVRNDFKWADGKMIKSEVEMQLLDLLGPKTEEDMKPQPKTKEKKKKPEEKKENEETSGTISELMKNKVHFHKVGENWKTDGYVVTPNTKKLLAEHVKAVNGKVRTRFPPEPNGILHIGHAKAININFGYAAAYDGECILRYDDTNPEKEEEKFFVAIKDIVEWLGYKPAKITHSSDYFDQLYEWAVKLIKKGLAYVCHQRQEEIQGFNPPPSPYRDRPIDENLRLFEEMKNGIWDEGSATLRMKVTLEEGKQDPVAYRIKFLPHHRTGDLWCIYPTYDYTHCLCDSIENITHSLCTKEFQSRRSSYYWLCNALDLYCPVQWEFARLNVNYTVTSKRKIAKLIEERIVSDWDDPRLFTLTALRRRGFPPEAINNFCARMGVSAALSSVDPQALEACVRDVLNTTAPRTMVVLDPLKVVIENFPSDKPLTFNVSNFPFETPQGGEHSITMDRVIYIERDDFKEVPEAGYKRLTPKQTVGFRYSGFVFQLSNVVKDAAGVVTELRGTCKNSTEISGNEKPQAYIHWVSAPIEITARLYGRLFRHPNPDDSTQVPNGFLSDCDPDSCQQLTALADGSLQTAKPGDQFQFERMGYFIVDRESGKKLVFNRTVTMKEDSKK